MRSTIIINATNIGKYIDGIGVYALNLIRELSNLEGDRHFIIYLNRSCIEHLKEIRFPERCEVRFVSGLVSPDHGFRGHFLRLLLSNYLGLKYWRSTIFIASQLEAILFRRNQIITIHDIIPLLFKKLHRKQYFYFKFVLKHVLKRAGWIITPSHHTKDLLVQRYALEGSKIQVIHNGVRDSIFTEPHPHAAKDDSKFVLFSGRMVPMKNLSGLLRAFSLIKDRVPHKVVVAGHCSGKDPAALASELLGQSSLEQDRVEFKGHVSSTEMDDLLNRASLLVFPSFYEGFGLPPLEGMAHGCPVVVSKVSSLPEVCGDAAEYVDPSNDQSIAEGMYRVLTNDAVRGELIEKGLKRSKLFHWKESARQHLKMFDHAIDSAEAHGPSYGVQRSGLAAASQYSIPIGAQGLNSVQDGSQPLGMTGLL